MINARQQLRQGFAFLLLCAAVLVGSHLVAGTNPALSGPAWEATQLTRDFVSSGRFDSARYYALDRYFLARSAHDHSVLWQDIFAYDRFNLPVGFQRPILALIAGPFYLIFGDAAFVLVNALLWLVLIGSASYLSFEFSGRKKLFPGLVLLLLGTGVLFFVYSFSADLLGAAMVISGLALIVGARSLLWSFAGGLLIGLSAFTRGLHLLYCPLVVLALCGRPAPSWKAFIAAGLGAAIGATWYLGHAYLVWGHPLLSPYHRLTAYRDGNTFFQAPYFSTEVLFSHWSDKLFSTDYGWFLWAPALLLVPYSFYRSRFSPWKSAYVVMSLVALLQVLAIFSFEQWNITSNGNRFLLPATFLLSIIAASWCNSFVESASRKPRLPV